MADGGICVSVGVAHSGGSPDCVDGLFGEEPACQCGVNMLCLQDTFLLMEGKGRFLPFLTPVWSLLGLSLMEN